MRKFLQIRTALKLSRNLERRARGWRRDLRDHTRHESSRIQEAEERARGLRLYAAWSRAFQERQAARRERPAVWRPEPDLSLGNPTAQVPEGARASASSLAA